MPVVNGINYNEKMITDEELAVVKAMRAGAKVSATFYDSSYEEAAKNADELDIGFDKRWYDLTKSEEGRVSFLNLDIVSKNGNTTIKHYIDAERKSHSAGKQ